MSQNMCIHHLGLLVLYCSLGNKLLPHDVYCLHEIAVSRKSSLKLLSREGYSAKVCTDIFPDLLVPLFHIMLFILVFGRDMLILLFGILGLWGFFPRI